RFELGEAADRRCGARREARSAKDVFGLRGGVEHIVRRERRTVTEVREQVSAEQRAGGLFVDDVRVPAVRDMWCLDVAHAFAAEVALFVGVERYGRAVGEVVDRNHAAV